MRSKGCCIYRRTSRKMCWAALGIALVGMFSEFVAGGPTWLTPILTGMSGTIGTVAVAGFGIAIYRGWRERGARLDRGFTIHYLLSSWSDHAAPKGFLIDWLMPPDRASDVMFNLLGRYDYWVRCPSGPPHLSHAVPR
jgi:hypothetical protein